MLAYAVGQLGGLVPLPGGVGGTDGGLILAFGLLGTPVAVAAAAVIGYRAFQLGVPAILGLAAFARLRRTPRRRASAVERRPSASRGSAPMLGASSAALAEARPSARLSRPRRLGGRRLRALGRGLGDLLGLLGDVGRRTRPRARRR